MTRLADSVRVGSKKSVLHLTGESSSLAFDGQPSALVITETRTFAELFLEDPNLLFQVFNDCLLSAIHPPAKANQQKRQWTHRNAIPLSAENDDAGRDARAVKEVRR
jgi:hypothetical protein